MYIKDWFKPLNLPLFIPWLPRKLKFLIPVVDPPPSAKLGSCVNLFGQPARFVLFGTCHNVNIISVIAWFSFVCILCHSALSHESAYSYPKYVLLRYIHGFVVCWLHTPPPIPCHMKFVQRGFTKRAAVEGVSLRLVEGLLFSSELAMLRTDAFRLSTYLRIDKQFLSCSRLCFPFFLSFLSSTPNIGL